jgi:hypothetical protein
MSELDIATNKVLPELIKRYNFNEESIDGYGRVPIQVGQNVVWADYVCYYYDNNNKLPFCVIEVKECEDDSVDFAVPQAESYAQQINAPFFCCTNGQVYHWFMTGIAQGKSLILQGCPTLPHPIYLIRPNKITIAPYMYEAIKNYESSILQKGRIYTDSLWHNNSTQNLNCILWDNNKLQDITYTLTALKENTMRSRGKEQWLKNIEENYKKFLMLIDWLKKENINIDERLTQSIGKHSNYGIDNGGMFFISQIISGLYPKYTVIEQNAVDAMLRFGLINIRLKVDSVKEYLYFNKICLDVFPYFENPFKFNLSYVHNFLWHYENEYMKNGNWD